MVTGNDHSIPNLFPPRLGQGNAHLSRATVMAEAALEAQRWRGRPTQAMVVRALAFMLPIGASVAAAAVASRALPRPETIVMQVGWWVLLSLLGTLTLLGADRVTRRLLPLSTLLKLSLVFPDQAPSRFAVALRAGTARQLEERVEEAGRKGAGDDSVRDAQTVLELSGALNAHDRRTRGHSERVRALADLLGEEMGLKPRQRELLHWSALLHDVGKVRVAHEILNKPGAPTQEEWEALQRHPLEGEKLVAPLAPWLGEWALAVGEHHERWDGTGYPRQLKGEEISLAARIVAVADSFETMTAARPYKRPMSAEAAREELSRCAGSQFDPTVVRAFLSIAIGRLRLVMGPLSWLAQLPVVGRLPMTPALGMGISAVVAAGTALLGPLLHAPAPAPAARSAARSAPTRSVDAPLSSGSSSPAEPAVPQPAPAPEANPEQAAASRGPDEARPVSAQAGRSTDSAGGPSELGGVTAAGRAAPVPTSSSQPTQPAAQPTTPPSPSPMPPAPALSPQPVAPNRAPVAVNDAATTTSDATAMVLVLANDTDLDSDPLIVTAAGPAANGTVVVGFGGIVAYTPVPGYAGSDSFAYTVSDDKGGSATGTVSVAVVPPPPDLTTYYLAAPEIGDVASVPVLALIGSAPTDATLRNYDPDRDTVPGLVLAKSESGLSESDPKKHQVWSSSLSSPLKLEGPASLTVWAAVKDFETTKTGRVVAAMQECRPNGTSCATVASGSARADHESGGPRWIRSTIELGDVERTIGAGKVVAVKIVVDEDSDDDMWFAFGTADYASSLQLNTR